MFYRARYYDPKIGRFISEDPIGFEGKDINLYRYVYNIPLNIIDPSGKMFGNAKFNAFIVTAAWRALWGAVIGFKVSGGTACGAIVGAIAGAATPIAGYLAATFINISNALIAATVSANLQGAAAAAVVLNKGYCVELLG